ncbi:MAG TPA: transglycosylase SLT domain-containing protein [Microvirga sp.]|jgi:hypothetical protein|nr:transglycosylase SLT domain-containing protein [Microvirga sp.]
MFLFTTPQNRSTASGSVPQTPVVDAIRQGAEKTGVGFDYLLKTAQRESALNPGAKAPTSSATGLFQFIEQTWLGLIKSEGAKAGLPDMAQVVSTRQDGTHAVTDPRMRQAILELRQDPEVASVMAGALTQKNREQLTAELGREPSGADLYIAHFLGARGAADLIRTAERSPGRAAAADFPDAAGANRTIFYDRDGRARGAGEVYAMLAQSHAGTSAAPAFAPDRPLAFAQTDGPAFHGLFQTAGRSGAVSEAVAKLWRTGRGEAGVQTAALAFFPNSTGASTLRDAVPSAENAPAAVPLPPPRPDAPPATKRVNPLDLTSFMKWRRT